MKAIKLTKINWDLRNLSVEEREEAKKNLPTLKGFTVDDNFNVQERVPHLLKKKYGYDVIDFSYNEYRIVENVEDLFVLCAPKGKKVKDVFNANHKFSKFGEFCWDRLQYVLKLNESLRKKNTLEENIPKIVDEVLLGVNKVFEIDTDNTPADKIIETIYKTLFPRKKRELTNIKTMGEVTDPENFDEDDFEMMNSMMIMEVKCK